MNLADRFLSHPPDRVAIEVGDRSVGYGELYDRSARWRGGLLAAGIGAGDRVVVISGNDETFVVADVAVIGAGAVIVPLNPQSPPAALAGEIAMTRPAAVVVGAAGLGAWAQVASDLGPQAPKLLDVSALDRAEPAPATSTEPDDPAAMLLTSGTAGSPRPAILTHGNLGASLDSMFSLPIDLRAAHHVVLAVIPLFHVFGLNAVVHLALAAGSTLVLDDVATPARVAELVGRHRVTVLAGPPTLWRALAASAEARADQFRSVQLAVSGAAKLPPDVRLAVLERLEVEVAEGYGLTETCAVAATAAGSAAPAGTVGRLLPGVEARIVDEDGADVLVGDPGELWLRGPMISPGYFSAGPEASSEAGVDSGSGGAAGGEVEPRTADGWLRTGDVAVVDDGGNLSIVDRIKDVVIVSGFNVFPGEVETALRSHPDVAEAGVVGRPDPATGEALVAHVVPVAGRSVEVEDLIEHCRHQLARYKVPRRIELRSELPVGIAGKVRRRLL